MPLIGNFWGDGFKVRSTSVVRPFITAKTFARLGLADILLELS